MGIHSHPVKADHQPEASLAEVVVKRIRERSLMVRYADDAVMGFESREIAEKVLQALRDCGGASG